MKVEARERTSRRQAEAPGLKRSIPCHASANVEKSECLKSSGGVLGHEEQVKRSVKRSAKRSGPLGTDC